MSTPFLQAAYFNQQPMYTGPLPPCEAAPGTKQHLLIRLGTMRNIQYCRMDDALKCGDRHGAKFWQQQAAYYDRRIEEAKKR